MRAPLIARSYADTLIALAQKHGGAAGLDDYGRAIDAVATLLRQEPRVRAFLESPVLPAEAKKQALKRAFTGQVPPLFLRFLLVVVDKRRERLLGEIATAYHEQVDQLMGRVRADITLAHPAEPGLERELHGWLERRLGRQVIPRFRVDPALLGGVVIQVEDEVLDGSVRRRLSELRHRLLHARLPGAASAL